MFRILNEFEAHVDYTSDDCQHQDQKPVNQKRFQTDVLNLLAVLDDIGNPFSEITGILMALDADSHPMDNRHELQTRSKF